MTDTPPDADECADILKASAQRVKTDFHIATSPPDRYDTRYPPARYTCPHNIHYWLWPTQHQADTWEDTA